MKNVSRLNPNNIIECNLTEIYWAIIKIHKIFTNYVILCLLRWVFHQIIFRIYFSFPFLRGWLGFDFGRRLFYIQFSFISFLVCLITWVFFFKCWFWEFNELLISLSAVVVSRIYWWLKVFLSSDFSHEKTELNHWATAVSFLQYGSTAKTF